MYYAKNWISHYDWGTSRPGKMRFAVFDVKTNKCLDDANGYGYKTKENAIRSYGYKYMRSEFYREWMSNKHYNPVSIKFMTMVFMVAECLEDMGVDISYNSIRIVYYGREFNNQTFDNIMCKFRMPKKDDKKKFEFPAMFILNYDSHNITTTYYDMSRHVTDLGKKRQNLYNEAKRIASYLIKGTAYDNSGRTSE